MPASANGDLTTAPLISEPLGVLVRRLAIPASMGFFFNTMYNVVDTFYAGRFSTDALAALSLTFPVFFVFIAMASGFSTGATALMGQALGAGDRRAAALVAAQGVIMGSLLTVVVMTTGYLAAPSLYRLLGATDAYLDICLEYLNVILLGAPVVLTFYMFNGILNAQGDTHSFRDYLLVATIVNIGLDPWFMYGGLGVPAMGVSGIALATVLAQTGGAVFLGWRARRTGLLYRSEGARWRPHAPTLRAIAAQGLPASLNMMTVALGIFIITYFLSEFGQHVVAAYGVATRIEQMVLLPAIGLNTAVLTLTAQNAGAGRFDRVRRTVRTALRYGTYVMVVGTALIFLGARPLMGLFTDDSTVIAVGVPYLRIAAFIQLAYVALFINTSALQGLKRPAFALWIGLGRQIITPVVLFFLATRVLDTGLMGIWWSIFGMTWLAALVAVVFAQGEVRRLENAHAAAARPSPAAAPGSTG